MSQKNRPPHKQAPADPAKDKVHAAGATTPFNMPHPLLCLAIVVIVVYAPTFSMGYTDLDDGLDIQRQLTYHQHLSSIFSAFRESVLVDVAADIYYRPIYVISLILNSQFSGSAISGYHLVNVLLHICAVCTFYKLLLKLNIRAVHSFLLALVLAVHPALVMAVSWIPGRIDVIPAIFTSLFLAQSIEYSDSGRPRALALSGLYLLLGLFSKESVVFVLPAAAIMHILYRQRKWNDKNLLVQYGTWALCFGMWFVARSMAHLAPMNIAPGAMVASIFRRIPVIGQYLGKALLPFDLSVFPNAGDTANYAGILAIILVAALLLLEKRRDLLPALAGFAIFVVLMIPMLMIPENINKQTFEFRLYLPMFGLLLMLPRTVLFRNRLSEKQLFASGVGVCCLLSALNLRHQEHFSSPLAFWTNAVETSPHDSYAHMMLSARVGDPAESERLFHRAFELNPRERYVNYIYATMLQEKGDILGSEKYLLIEKEVTGYSRADLLLSRVERKKENYDKAISYVHSYLHKEPVDTMGNLNLLILHMEADHDNDARKQEHFMDSMGLAIPDIIRGQIKR